MITKVWYGFLVHSKIVARRQPHTKGSRAKQADVCETWQMKIVLFCFWIIWFKMSDSFPLRRSGIKEESIVALRRFARRTWLTSVLQEHHTLEEKCGNGLLYLDGASSVKRSVIHGSQGEFSCLKERSSGAQCDWAFGVQQLMRLWIGLLATVIISCGSAWSPAPGLMACWNPFPVVTS